MKQLKLFNEKIKLEFGGSSSKGRRKTQRPLNLNLPIHLVLRADVTKSNTFLDWETYIKNQLSKWSSYFKIAILEQAIVYNHIHLLIQAKDRASYNNFIRTLTGKLAIKTNAKWTSRPYTRMVTRGRDYQNVQHYVIKNQLEGWGIVAHHRPNK